jgi:hypothetical protein
MLLPDARMQIRYVSWAFTRTTYSNLCSSFLKDLATLRNPRSPITFLSYLQSQNRLVTFINRGSTIPTRKEYADYLAWAAQYVQDRGIPVCFGSSVTSIEDGPDDTLLVTVQTLASGEETVYRTRELCCQVFQSVLKQKHKGILSSLLVALQRCLVHWSLFWGIRSSFIAPAIPILLAQFSKPLRTAPDRYVLPSLEVGSPLPRSLLTYWADSRPYLRVDQDCDTKSK